MSEWQPLSVRRGLKPVPPLQVGFSRGASLSLIYWLEGEFGYRTARSNFDALVMKVAMVCDIVLDPRVQYQISLMRQLIDRAVKDGDTMLDVLDATLAKASHPSADSLRQLLADTNSAWTVREDGRALVSRVDATTTEAYQQATTPADDASAELQEAWAQAYGKEPDASDAWDHSIKAVEAVLIPIVVPGKEKANLGSVAGQLKANPAGFRFVIEPNPDAPAGIRTIEEMIRLMWPNPDRHAGAKRRTPSNEEARAVVHMAVTLVQWARDGAVARV